MVSHNLFLHKEKTTTEQSKQEHTHTQNRSETKKEETGKTKGEGEAPTQKKGPQTKKKTKKNTTKRGGARTKTAPSSTMKRMAAVPCRHSFLPAFSQSQRSFRAGLSYAARGARSERRYGRTGVKSRRVVRFAWSIVCKFKRYWLLARHRAEKNRVAEKPRLGPSTEAVSKYMALCISSVKSRFAIAALVITEKHPLRKSNSTYSPYIYIHV